MQETDWGSGWTTGFCVDGFMGSVPSGAEKDLIFIELRHSCIPGTRVFCSSIPMGIKNGNTIEEEKRKAIEEIS